MGQPPLRPLHRDESLNKVKLAQLERLHSEELLRSLEPGQSNCLRVRPDGTMLEGHHRIHVLRGRGVDVDAIPRQIEKKRIEE
jgi:hypothetical protein